MLSESFRSDPPAAAVLLVAKRPPASRATTGTIADQVESRIPRTVREDGLAWLCGMTLLRARSERFLL